MRVERNGPSLITRALIAFCYKILLEQGNDASSSICERMQDYQAIAMVVVLGPKLKHIESQMEEDVKKMMSGQLRFPSIGSSTSANTSNKPRIVASCSKFGTKGGIGGVVVRVASMTTEAVYSFLQHELASMEELLGAPPYR